MGNPKLSQCRCFVCSELQRTPTTSDEQSAWVEPAGAVNFYGSGNWCSSEIDSGTDGIKAEIMICDKCIRKGKNRIRFYYDA